MTRTTEQRSTGARSDVVLAIDQGTTSSRAIAFDMAGRPVATASSGIRVSAPQPGWVEFDPLEIERSVVTVVSEVLLKLGTDAEVRAAGLANQGETVVAWDAESRDPLSPAISWQCRRSTGIVEELIRAGHDPRVTELTGLSLDPYYSAGKMTWLLRNSEAVERARARGTLRFGTVDAWLVARLGAGTPPVTDHSTASRTQLFDIRRLAWHPELLALFGVEATTLPAIVPSIGSGAVIAHPDWGRELPLTAMACDQQAALFGHGGLREGTVKVTYGTGAFGVANIGSSARAATGLETSVGWTSADGPATYILQGGVLSAASFVNWARDTLDLLEGRTLDAALGEAPGPASVRILPAPTGLGTPWLRPDATAVISGVTLATSRANIAHAIVDGICQLVADVVESMADAIGSRPDAIRVDGGLAASAGLLQRQADLLGVPVERSAVLESTALGIAAMAAAGAGDSSLVELVSRQPVSARFEPSLAADERAQARAAWRSFVASALPG